MVSDEAAPDSDRRPHVADRGADSTISIVVPVFNEEGCVDEMVRRLGEVMDRVGCDYEVIFVDDGSSDGTLAAVRAASEVDARIRYVSFSRNFGHQKALVAGFAHATGDAVISLDGDLQHPPELIETLVGHWRDGYDVVYTVRMGNEGHAAKELISGWFYWLLRKLTGVAVPTGGADFRLLDRRAADALRDCDEQFIFVRGLVPWLGFRRKAVPYEAAERYAGSTKYVATRMLRFALDGIFSFSIVPLRLISILGAVTIALGIVYGFYSIAIFAFTAEAVSGWTSLMIVMLVFSGTQLLSLGILSEYVGRIYEEVKRRPRYVVAESSPELPTDRERGRE